MVRRILGAAAIALAIVFAAGCSGSPTRREKTYLEFFDTVSLITGYEEDEDKFNEVTKDVYDILYDYHRLADIYNSYEGINNLYTVNENAGVSPVTVDSRLIDMLLYAKKLYSLTGGMFDVTMGGVYSIWHDYRSDAASDPDGAQVPDMDKLSAAALHSGWDNIVIDENAQSVYISDPQASLDLGGIAKGYAVEQAASYLREQGLSGYALNIGGNISIVGARGDGSDWTVGIQSPEAEDGEPYVCRVKVKDISLVTSGDYQRYYFADGVRYHHIINPKTLMPENNFRAVTVMCRDSALGDCLSTALFNMSLEEGRELLDSLEGVQAMWVMPDGSTQMTDGFESVIAE